MVSKKSFTLLVESATTSFLAVLPIISDGDCSFRQKEIRIKWNKFIVKFKRFVGRLLKDHLTLDSSSLFVFVSASSGSTLGDITKVPCESATCYIFPCVFGTCCSLFQY